MNIYIKINILYYYTRLSRIFNLLNSTFGIEDPCLVTGKRWYNKFNRDCRALKTSFIRIHKTNITRSWHDNCEIEVTLGISSSIIYKILDDHLVVQKVSSRWIPHNHKIKQMLMKCNGYASKDLYNIGTGDKP